MESGGCGDLLWQQGDGDEMLWRWAMAASHCGGKEMAEIKSG